MDAERKSCPPGAAEYEFRHHTLGGSTRLSAQIAELARSGWELVDLQVPHYGALMAIGLFRRALAKPRFDERERHSRADDPDPA